MEHQIGFGLRPCPILVFLWIFSSNTFLIGQHGVLLYILITSPEANNCYIWLVPRVAKPEFHEPNRSRFAHVLSIWSRQIEHASRYKFSQMNSTDSNVELISNGNRTEWSPIRYEIIRVSNKIGRPRSGSPICLITSMIADRIGRHEVLLPINHNFNKIFDI